MFVGSVAGSRDVGGTGEGNAGVPRRGNHRINVNSSVNGDVFRQPLYTGLSRHAASCRRRGGAGRRRRSGRPFITGFKHHRGMLVEAFDQ